MISALMPFLFNSPPTSATHNTPWLGATAENATLTLSAAVPDAGVAIAATIVSPRIILPMPCRDRGQNIMAPRRLFECVPRLLRDLSRSYSDDNKVDEQRQELSIGIGCLKNASNDAPLNENCISVRSSRDATVTFFGHFFAHILVHHPTTHPGPSC